jgi:hypothetical protein
MTLLDDIGNDEDHHARFTSLAVFVEGTTPTAASVTPTTTFTATFATAPAPSTEALTVDI